MSIYNMINDTAWMHGSSSNYSVRLRRWNCILCGFFLVQWKQIKRGRKKAMVYLKSLMMIIVHCESNVKFWLLFSITVFAALVLTRSRWIIVENFTANVSYTANPFAAATPPPPRPTINQIRQDPWAANTTTANPFLS